MLGVEQKAQAVSVDANDSNDSTFLSYILKLLLAIFDWIWRMDIVEGFDVDFWISYMHWN